MSKLAWVCVLFLLAGCQSLATVGTNDIAGSWWVESINGEPVIDRSPATINFDPRAKRVSGNNSCNQYFADYKLQGEQIKLSAIGATRRLCLGVLNDQERRFMQALQQVDTVAVDGGALFIYNDSGKLVIKATRE